MRKQTKRGLALLLTLTLAVSLFSATVFAEETSGLVLAAEEVTAKAGETVDVSILVSENPGFVAMDLVIGYDETALTLNSVTVGEGFPPEVEDALGLTTINTETAGLCQVIVDASLNGGEEAAADLTATGKLLTLNFTVAAETAAGSYPVTLQVDSVGNNALEHVGVSAASGKVTVGSAGPLVDNLTGTSAPAECQLSEDGKTLNVQNNKACVVLVKQVDAEGNETYTRLPATANANGGYDFDLSTLPEGASVVVAVKGDVNGDGSVGAADRLMLAASLGGSPKLGGLAKNTGDVNGDGSVGAADRLMLAASLGGSPTLAW